MGTGREQAGTTDPDAVRQAMAGQTVQSPSGYTITMDARTITSTSRW